MNKIEEMAFRDLPVTITGNGWNDWDENEVKREGYILGANAVLEEVRKAYFLHIDNNDTCKDIIEKIKELKGE